MPRKCITHHYADASVTWRATTLLVTQDIPGRPCIN